MARHWTGWLTAALVGVVVAGTSTSTGCSLELDPPLEQRTVARYDLEDGVIPLPSDIVRDDAAARLDLPIEDDMTPAEVAFRTFLNESDAWSTTFPGKVEFSGPIDLDTVTIDSLQIWHWGAAPMRMRWEWEHLPHTAGFEGPVVEISDDGTELVINPPRAGWQRSDRYAMLVRGGDDGVRDIHGVPVDVDTAFYFVRMPVPLDAYENQRAFPGATREERLDTARQLEEVRLELDPYFRFLESSALPPEERVARDEIVALWGFTVTSRTELAMDRSSQRMPIPFNLLIDPDTGLVDLPEAAWDTELEAGAKKQLSELDGFGVSANLMFELTGPVLPHTATEEHIRLFQLGEPPTEVPIERIMVMGEQGEAVCQQVPVPEDCKYIVVGIEDAALPLDPVSTYALVVHGWLAAADPGPIRPMAIGHFMHTTEPLVVDGVNQLESVPDDLALRLENTRKQVAPLLDLLGRQSVITAWPFTTMNALPDVHDAVDKAATLAVPADPMDVDRQTIHPGQEDVAFESLFPGPAAQVVREAYGLRLDGVERVVRGSINVPYHLDRETRRFREDGSYDLEPVKFVMSIPENVGPEPVPVVIFAHAVVTDRRFLLTIAGPLAQRGFAAIAIDLPFHGDRIACVERTLVAIPNFLSQELKDLLGFHDSLINFPPCVSGPDATCSPTGGCLDPNGHPEPFTSLLMLDGKPAVFDLRPASGAAFLDIDDIPYIKDHFLQAVMDLGALKHSLREGHWTQATGGVELHTDGEFYFAGQSLGAILGAVYAAADDDMYRTVLNVPGADMVDLFMDSLYFGPQFSDFFVREGIAEGSFEQERLLNIARWLIDSVDPHSIAHLFRNSGRPGYIQIDTGPPTGDIVIPNRTTQVLQRVSGLPMREYPSFLHADLVVPLLGDAMLESMAEFLAGKVIQ